MSTIHSMCPAHAYTLHLLASHVAVALRREDTRFSLPPCLCMPRSSVGAAIYLTRCMRTHDSCFACILMPGSTYGLVLAALTCQHALFSRLSLHYNLSVKPVAS
jgi:hypothetical protein